MKKVIKKLSIMIVMFLSFTNITTASATINAGYVLFNTRLIETDGESIKSILTIQLVMLQQNNFFYIAVSSAMIFIILCYYFIYASHKFKIDKR